MEQIIISDYAAMDCWLHQNGAKRAMLICGKSIERQLINQYFNTLFDRQGVEVVRFMDFTPNPQYESVAKGVELFQQQKCDTIIAVGGGSAMDVAKCIKLYSGMDSQRNYLEQEIVPNNVPFLAIPTTAGTGSEATRYAVIYYNGVKQSVSHPSCIPAAVMLDSSMLKTLPPYQKKSTMMDAFSHALESFWSINSTDQSKEYSRDAIGMILQHMDGYLANTDEGNQKMLLAANTAGKAINITQTTAGHAMCYKITSLYGIAHGHAAALCNRELFPWMIEHTGDCTDPRGEQYLISTFQEIADAMGCVDAKAAAEKYREIFRKLALDVPKAEPNDYLLLQESVNQTRLKNNPVRLTSESISALYHNIFEEKL